MAGRVGASAVETVVGTWNAAQSRLDLEGVAVRSDAHQHRHVRARRRDGRLALGTHDHQRHGLVRRAARRPALTPAARSLPRGEPQRAPLPRSGARHRASACGDARPSGEPFGLAHSLVSPVARKPSTSQRHAALHPKRTALGRLLSLEPRVARPVDARSRGCARRRRLGSRAAGASAGAGQRAPTPRSGARHRASVCGDARPSAPPSPRRMRPRAARAG